MPSNSPIGVLILRLEDGEHDIHIRVQVSDPGVGISPEAQRKIFESFGQAHSSTTRKYVGTGLKLAICKRIVELSGGTIGVESQLGQGSVFWFTLRLQNIGKTYRLTFSQNRVWRSSTVGC